MHSPAIVPVEDLADPRGLARADRSESHGRPSTRPGRALSWLLLMIIGSTVACSTDAPRSRNAATAEGAREDVQPRASAPPDTPTNPDRVTLGEEAFRTARLAVERPRLESLGAGEDVVEFPAQVEVDLARVAFVSARVSGRLERLLAVPGDRVSAGQTVALLQSPAFILAQNDYLQTGRRLQRLRGTSDEAGAKALRDAARRRLDLIGIDQASIERLDAGNAPEAFLSVAAPFAGSIIESPALAGQAVDAGTPLYRIADLSVVVVAADVPERALSAVRVGERALIHAIGAGAATIPGRVTRISDVLDADRRSAKAYIQVANPRRALKPGMFATVQLQSAEATVAHLTVPETAVIVDGAARYVFVEVGLRSYERRPVELAPTRVAGAGPGSGRLAIVSGLSAADRVVTRGAFTLKSELAKATLSDPD